VKSKKKERNEEIAKLFLDGYTANEIGRMHSISKQRVSFILHKLGIRAEESFTTTVLTDPYVVALDFGDVASRVMMDWSAAKILPKFDCVITSTPNTAHVDLRQFSSREHVLAYVPKVEGCNMPGREIRSNWLVYAYPLEESRFNPLAELNAP
jgi:hypothetical protein